MSQVPVDTPSNAPRRRVWLWLLPFLLFVVLALLLGSRLGKTPEVTMNATTGKPLPAFALPDLADGQVRRPADLPKKPFILNVWASWCPSCKAEHPMLRQLAQSGVLLVGVNYKDQPMDALAYLAKHGNPFVLNIQDQAGGLGLDLGLTGSPESFVIDAEGRIRQHLVGVINAQNWAEQLQPCLTALQQASAERAEAVCR